MSWFDSLADLADRKGQTEAEFRVSGEKHANATLVFLIAGGIIWYFAGWQWALIAFGCAAYAMLKGISATGVANKLADRRQSHSIQSGNEAERIVQAYGEFLETNAPTPGTVADISKLPFPKEKIKQALLYAIKTSDDSELVSAMKTTYILLADWQEGVGNEDIGLDSSKIDMSKDIQNVAGDIKKMMHDPDGVLDKARQERERLVEDLERLDINSGTP